MLCRNDYPKDSIAACRSRSDAQLAAYRALAAEKSIQYQPAKSVLKLQIGDPIKLSETGFIDLAAAFFREIEAKYS